MDLMKSDYSQSALFFSDSAGRTGADFPGSMLQDAGFFVKSGLRAQIGASGLIPFDRAVPVYGSL
jgi:hypothetical protein